VSILSREFFVGAILISCAGIHWACLGSVEPDVGPLQSTTCLNADSEPEHDVSFREDIVPQIFEPKPLGCLQCHAPGAPTPIGFEVSGLDLSSYAGTKSGGANGTSATVIAGRPCDSILYQKVSSGPPFGARMPIGGPPYLSEDALALLHDWIAEGAKNN